MYESIRSLTDYFGGLNLDSLDENGAPH